MSRYLVGCMGWGYDEWQGPFYPPGTPAVEYLPRYARVFDLAEVDSSFYRPPSSFLTSRWASVTPERFVFSLKIPREITHEGPAEGVEERAQRFLQGIEPLARSGKLGPVVAQFPPSFRRDRDSGKLERLLALLSRKGRIAVELRHSSWWVEDTRRLLEEHKAALVWSVVPQTQPPPWVTSDFLYARFVGDRALTRFDRIQRNLRPEMEAMKVQFDKEGLSAIQVYALINNHYMGFGPGSAQILQEVLGLPVADLTAASRTPGQHRLTES